MTAITNLDGLVRHLLDWANGRLVASESIAADVVLAAEAVPS